MDIKEHPKHSEVTKVKVKPYQHKILIVLIIVLVISAIPPTIGSITGDGFSWNSLTIYSAATKGGAAIVNGDATRLERGMGFSGTRGALSADELAKYLENLRVNKIQIVKTKINLFSCKQEDRFPQTIVSLVVLNGSEEYQINCLGTVQSGKLMLIRFYNVWNSKDDEPLADTLSPVWIEELESILCTYSPG